MLEVRDVFEWLKSVIEVDIKCMKKWLDASREERKEFETLKGKGKEMNGSKIRSSASRAQRYSKEDWAAAADHE
ncbi:hypothetical protein PsorP6_014265 [Peronosclerospora sorghi]|uniref:Uncharacterized protein n=1 Tax=Peronosclerospora sorghi TaxID=230839 RepID=A0ACC0VIB2_9STRA|nr:hypothetical protein PsorP6_014265 [Peronosclerospora sorghi]